MRFRRFKNGKSLNRKNYKTVSMLLQEDCIDWDQLKRRVKSHPQEGNKNLIHKLCLDSNTPPGILNWAIEQFGEQQLARKSGILSRNEPMTPMELCLSQGDVISIGTFKRIIEASMKGDKELFFADFPVWKIQVAEISLAKLKCLLEECPLKHFEEQLFDYLFEPILSGMLEFDDMERMELILGSVRRLWNISGMSITSSQKEKSEVAEENKDEYLVPHTYLLAMFEQLYPYFDRIKPDDIRILMRSFLEEENYRQQFTQVDANSNSLLHHIFLNANERILIIRDKNINGDDSNSEIIYNDSDYQERTKEQRLAPWIELLKFFLELHPECVGTPNRIDRTPFHICLEQGLPGALVMLPYCHDAVESIDPITKLYPFQLAASLPTIGDEHNEQQKSFQFDAPVLDNNGDIACLCEYHQSHYQQRSHSFPFGIYIADGPLPGSSIMMHFDQSSNNNQNGQINNEIEIGNISLNQKENDLEGDLHLTRIYHLLRSAPYILNSLNIDTSLLDSNLFKQINYKKWQVAKLSRQYYLRKKVLVRDIQNLKEQIKLPTNVKRVVKTINDASSESYKDTLRRKL